MVERVREHVIFWLSVFLTSAAFYASIGALGFALLSGAVSVLLSIGVLVL